MKMDEQTQQTQTEPTTLPSLEPQQPAINYEETLTNLKQSNDLLKNEISLLKTQISNLVNAFGNRTLEDKPSNKQNFEKMRGDFI